MGRPSSDENKEALRHIIEDLTRLIDDESREITALQSLSSSSTCYKCNDYGDQLFETLTIVSEKK